MVEAEMVVAFNAVGGIATAAALVQMGVVLQRYWLHNRKKNHFYLFEAPIPGGYLTLMAFAYLLGVLVFATSRLESIAHFIEWPLFWVSLVLFLSMLGGIATLLKFLQHIERGKK